MPANHAFSFMNNSSFSNVDESYAPTSGEVQNEEEVPATNGGGDVEEIQNPEDAFLSANDSSNELNNSLHSSLNEPQGEAEGQEQAQKTIRRDSFVGRSGVICTNPDYYIQPSVEELDLQTDVHGNCFIRGFVVGRFNYGQVKYLDVVNVGGINIDKTGELCDEMMECVLCLCPLRSALL
jgi:hypothetical protein